MLTFPVDWLGIQSYNLNKPSKGQGKALEKKILALYSVP